MAVWVPARPGMQAALIERDPQTFFRPPYVGVKGWVGIVLDEVSDDDLSFHVSLAWELIAPKRLLKQTRRPPAG